MLKGKHILVGISGGIAAYKIPFLIRLFRKNGAEVKVCATANALQFVTVVTLETLSGNKVYTDVFAPHNEHSTEHISLYDWADLMIVAPATANSIGKMANGIADDALTTTFLAMRKPVLIAPAMNSNMLAHPAVTKNIATLKSWQHVTVLDTGEGFLACGTTGSGRMAEPEDILRAADKLLEAQTFTGKRILITAGPTREAIDPVRYISNHSSGKMAYALASEFLKRGGEVTIVSGPVADELKQKAKGCRIADVTSAGQMFDAATTFAANSDIIVLCAAVADFTPAEYSDIKLKRHDEMTLPLRPTQDIAAAIGRNKTTKQLLVGFALETNNETENAQQKLKSKNLDMIVLNSLRDDGAGFGVDTNKITIISGEGEQHYPLKSKQEVACDIVDFVEHKLYERPTIPEV